MAYDDELKGSLFKNTRKTEPKQPDYTGIVQVDGKKYRMAGWLKEAGPQSKNPGLKFMSISLTKEEEKPKEDPKYSGDVPF
jgi:hypothetical protein